VRLNEVRLLGESETVVGNQIYMIAFLCTDDDQYTWRGVGQSCPINSYIFAVGKVYIGERGEPVGVELCQGFDERCVDVLKAEWGLEDLFEPHQVRVRPCVQFERV
jgi:hypothetical protein